MPTEHKPGQTQAEAMAEVDPSKDDPVCIDIQVGYKFCGDLKKKVTHFANLITNRPAAILALPEEQQKGVKVVTPEILAAKDVLHAFYLEGAKNEHIDSMAEVMDSFYACMAGLGDDIENIKKFNVEFTKCTRAVFKTQQATLAKLKLRKKELLALAKENQS